MKDRLSEQELEDKIWLNANSWISKTCLCKNVGGDKKTCFDRIKLMIPIQLKEKREKNNSEGNGSFKGKRLLSSTTVKGN